MAFNESQCISTSATDAGNITSRKEYARTNSEKGELLDTVVYTYDDSEWGDLLTAYDGKPITYDGIGNILTYDGWTFNWEHGRELASMSKDTVTWTYTYDANGMRTSRTNGTTTYNYVYNGSQLTQMTVGTDTLCFTYDASGIPTTVTLNGVVYYYITNMQGDVVGIYTADGTSVCYYNYDAWGRPVTVTNDDNYTIDDLNPLRYRGYVFDQDTGLFYLQSRYYNPTWGRFINADALVSTGQGQLGNNMFAYCGNNPVDRIDASGYSFTDVQKHRISSEYAFAQDICVGVGGGAIIGALLLDPSVVTTAVNLVEDSLNAIVHAVEHLITAAQHEIEILKESLQQEYQYWEAYRINNIVCIGKGLTIIEASARVSCGFSIMCANEGAARWLLILNGYWNHTAAEIHGGAGYYWHYHPHRNSHTHIWFY